MSRLDSILKNTPASDEIVIATLYLNERPLQGISGFLDWEFLGRISEYVREGKLTGERGEITLLPLKNKNHAISVLFLGMGRNDSAGERLNLGRTELEHLKKNISSLRVKKVSLFKDDFGKTEPSLLKSAFNGVELCLH